MNLRAFFLMRMSHLLISMDALLIRRKTKYLYHKYDMVIRAKRLYPSIHLCLSKQSDWTQCLLKEMSNQAL